MFVYIYYLFKSPHGESDGITKKRMKNTHKASPRETNLFRTLEHRKFGDICCKIKFDIKKIQCPNFIGAEFREDSYPHQISIPQTIGGHFDAHILTYWKCVKLASGTFRRLSVTLAAYVQFCFVFFWISRPQVFVCVEKMCATHKNKHDLSVEYT